MFPSVSERLPFAKLRHFGDFAYFAGSTAEFSLKWGSLVKLVNMGLFEFELMLVETSALIPAFSPRAKGNVLPLRFGLVVLGDHPVGGGRQNPKL